ncbi:mucin-12-like [Haliotis asinina]|uniref:mucin-12-like n=1 Tax=Haliotis asinina TaxID=109174 RepID=UPI00353240EB
MSPRTVISVFAVVCVCLASTEGRAFKNEKARFKRQAWDRCHGRSFEDVSGEINVGFGQYGNNEDCCFEMRPSLGGSFTVKLVFNVFDIEYNPRCSYDFITYRTSNGNAEIDCGTKTPGYTRFFNSTGSFQLCFHSDSSVVRRGIDVYYDIYQALPTLNFTLPQNNTTFVPGNTTFVPGNTTFVPGNTTFVPGNTTFVPGNTTFVPGNTTFVPGNTTFVPGNTTFVLGNTTFVPGNTTFVPGNTTFVPGNTTFVPGNTTFVPGNTTFVPGNTTFVPGNTTFVPGNTTFVPGNTTFVPGNTTFVPGNTTFVPGNTTFVPGNTTFVPGNTTFVPGNTTFVPGNTTFVPGNTTYLPGNTTFVPFNTTFVPGNTTVAPSNTTFVPVCNYDTNALEGTIELATDGYGFYANNDYCRISLHSPPLTHVTTITFTRFDVENARNCRYDSLSVSLGNGIVDKLCGNNRRPFVKRYTSAEPLLALTFTSDYSVTGRGFAFHYKTEIGKYNIFACHT